MATPAAAAAASTITSGLQPVRSAATRWHLFDARNQVVGRLAVHLARILQGKHLPNYSPTTTSHGDTVVVVNCDKVRLTGDKWKQKLYRHHTGYPGGLKEINAQHLHEMHPDRILRNAVAGNIRQNRLKLDRLRRLKLYVGPNHPHEAQFPIAVPLVEQIIPPPAPHIDPYELDETKLPESFRNAFPYVPKFGGQKASISEFKTQQRIKKALEAKTTVVAAAAAAAVPAKKK